MRRQAQPLTACAYDESTFSFSKLTDIYAPNFLPGALKYGDPPRKTKMPTGGTGW